MRTEFCSSCMFFRDIVEDEDLGETGTCKRYPPVLSPMSGEDRDEFNADYDVSLYGRYECSFCAWVQPRVHGEAWCGEYRERSKETNQ